MIMNNKAKDEINVPITLSVFRDKNGFNVPGPAIYSQADPLRGRNFTLAMRTVLKLILNESSAVALSVGIHNSERPK